MISIPFEIPEVHAGFSEAQGIVRIEDEFIVFQVEVVTMGMFRQKPEIIKIEFGAVDEVRFERRLISDRLYIRPKKPQLLEVMPGKHPIEIKLKIKRKHRTSTMLFVDTVRRKKQV